MIFSATGATQQSNVVLGANMTLNSLTFNDTNPVTIGNDGNTLTLMGSGRARPAPSAPIRTPTINANLALGAAQTWTVAGGKTLTVGGPVSGGFGLTTAGSGTVVLAGANTFTGTTNVTSGTLQVGLGYAAGSVTGPITVSAPGTLSYFSVGQTIADNVSGAGVWSITGSGGSGNGSFAITGNNSLFTGTVEIGANSRYIAGAVANLPSSSGNIVVTNGGSLLVSAVILLQPHFPSPESAGRKCGQFGALPVGRRQQHLGRPDHAYRQRPNRGIQQFRRGHQR